MINKIEFSAKNLTSNAGLFLLLEYANKNGVFDLIDHNLVFEIASTNKIKMNHIKTMLCGNFVGIDRLERLKLLQSDPLIKEFAISIKGPETVSRFLGNFSFKTTQMLLEECYAKGYNHKKPGNNCYNIQFAFCDELKAYITGFVRSGNTYTANPLRGHWRS